MCPVGYRPHVAGTSQRGPRSSRLCQWAGMAYRPQAPGAEVVQSEWGPSAYRAGTTATVAKEPSGQAPGCRQLKAHMVTEKVVRVPKRPQPECSAGQTWFLRPLMEHVTRGQERHGRLRWPRSGHSKLSGSPGSNGEGSRVQAGVASQEMGKGGPAVGKGGPAVTKLGRKAGCISPGCTAGTHEEHRRPPGCPQNR